jgi:hypothetical protein
MGNLSFQVCHCLIDPPPFLPNALLRSDPTAERRKLKTFKSHEILKERLRMAEKLGYCHNDTTLDLKKIDSSYLCQQLYLSQLNFLI